MQRRARGAKACECHYSPCCVVFGMQSARHVTVWAAADGQLPTLASPAPADAAAAALAAVSASAVALILLHRVRRDAFHLRLGAARRLDVRAGPELPDLRQLARHSARTHPAPLSQCFSCARSCKGTCCDRREIVNCSLLMARPWRRPVGPHDLASEPHAQLDGAMHKAARCAASQWLSRLVV